jgi:hypothetical protein
MWFIGLLVNQIPWFLEQGFECIKTIFGLNVSSISFALILFKKKRESFRTVECKRKVGASWHKKLGNLTSWYEFKHNVRNIVKCP